MQSSRQHISILGAGESGTGAALLAAAKGYAVFVSDMGSIDAERKSLFQAKNIRFEEGKHSEEEILSSTEIIKSPGIPETVPIIKKALERNIPVIDELEFGFRYTKAKIIAITGTNGKTTTTLLIAHLLKQNGIKAALAGNIGKSFAAQVLENTADWYVVEVSSFQIDGMLHFRPNIGVLLNITPDHLDRYDYKMEGYINSKLKLFANMNMKDTIIFNGEDPVIMNGRNRFPKNAMKVNFAMQHTANITINGDYFSYDLGAQKGSIPLANLLLKGQHNAMNAMAAIGAVAAAGVSAEQIAEHLSTFVGAKHRLEYIAEVAGVKYINDSKATNTNAVEFALDAFTTPLIWIAGGIDKGNDYATLRTLAKKHVKQLICLGKDNSKLVDAFEDLLPVNSFDNMEAAVTAASKVAESGDTVLLSPACSSFDLFKNYEHRGDAFRLAVQGLAENELNVKRHD